MKERALKSLMMSCLVMVMILGHSAVNASTGSTIRLTDVTEQTGIAFVHTDGGTGEKYLVESVSAGLALFDYDGDGDVDIYFLNGAPLKGTDTASVPTNALYRNDGGLKFTDVSEQAGVADRGYGLGVTVGDYDNDGDPDLYLNNFGPNVFYRNNGDGTFTDVTEQARVANGHKVGAGASFLDMDRDGDLDLYVSNYVQFAYDQAVKPTRIGYRIYGSPRDYPLVPDTLFRNNGDGTFTDVSQASGIGAHPGSGMGMVCADYDNDGDTDIFVANDVAGNFLFLNNGSGQFEESGLVSGFSYDLEGNAQGSMGVDCGDYNNDGWLDFYVTSYARELACHYKNTGDGFLDDVTLTTGAGLGTRPHVTWGNTFTDFDNDGDRDILVVCGHLQDNVEKYDDSTSYLARNIVLMNVGHEKFVNVSAQCGDGLKVKLSSRGAGFDDLDNDGDVDAVILNSRQGPTILRNDSPGNHWIQITLRGTDTNRQAVGSHVTVVSGKLTQLAEVHSGRGYQSHYGTRLHFGMGKHASIDRIDVRWLGGKTETYRDIPLDRHVTITQGNPRVALGSEVRK